MWHQKTYTEALLDSGATHNFIDKRAVKKLGLGTCNLPHTLRVNNVDGTENQVGSITEYCNLWLQQGSHIIKQGFYIANLGRDRIILGHPWFRTFNPTINWEKNQLHRDNIEIETAGYHRKKIVIPSDVTLHTQTAETPHINPSIPKYYHQHWKVFDETTSHHFPPAREEDHAITLKPGAPDTLNCKIYWQTEVELQTTKDFICDELAKGYIEESNSPYASPLFYQAKKDGKLRPIMDYKALNSWTVHNTYPLPLISNIIDHLQGKTLFTKFDIQWGYNNIRIKEEDRWKAAFKTPYGLYQPKVMYFGLTNSPPTFCRAMAKMFWDLLLKYPNNLFMYMDDVLIATDGDLNLHWLIVNLVLDLFTQELYFLWPSKCAWEQTQIEYLGLIVNGDKLTIDPKKANGLRNWPRTLNTVKEVWSILGVLGY